MFYQPELMIYLWLLPVLGMVVLPVLGALSSRLYQAAERSRLSDVRGFVDLNLQGPPDSGQQERRKHARTLIEAPKAHVARQVKCCRTIVTNISNQGICFSTIPCKMCEETDDMLKVVFRTPGRDYKMSVQPRWREKSKKGYRIGGEIIRNPVGWENFVNDLSKPLEAEAA